MENERENLLGRTIMQPIDAGGIRLDIRIPVPLVQWRESNIYYAHSEIFGFGGSGDSEESATADFIQKIGIAWERLRTIPNSERTDRAVLRQRLWTHFKEVTRDRDRDSLRDDTYQEASKFSAADIEDTISGDDPDVPEPDGRRTTTLEE